MPSTASETIGRRGWHLMRTYVVELRSFEVDASWTVRATVVQELKTQFCRLPLESSIPEI
ncbi:hypothetical protein A5698_22480 [Mycobacterium sp. E136]|nr:hypothetical protein A5698_22480 [Mycobacterium sp. E136]